MNQNESESHQTKMKSLIVTIVILLSFLLRTSSSPQSSPKSPLISENVKNYVRSSSSSKQDEIDVMYEPEDIDKLRRALSTMSTHLLDRMRVRALERVLINPNDAEKERARFLEMKNYFLQTVHQLNESLPIVVEEFHGVYGLSTIVDDLREFQDLRYQGFSFFSVMAIITWYELVRYIFVRSTRGNSYGTSSPTLDRQYIDLKGFEDKIMKSTFDPSIIK